MKRAHFIALSVVCAVTSISCLPHHASADESSIIKSLREDRASRLDARNEFLGTLGLKKGEAPAETILLVSPATKTAAVTSLPEAVQEQTLANPRTIFQQKLFEIIGTYDGIHTRVFQLATEKNILSETQPYFAASATSLSQARDAYRAIDTLLQGDNTALNRSQILNNLMVFRDAIKQSQKDLKIVLDLVKQSF